MCCVNNTVSNIVIEAVVSAAALSPTTNVFNGHRVLSDSCSELPSSEYETKVTSFNMSCLTFL